MVNYDGLYNKDFFGDRLNENHFSAKKLHFRIIENGTILPFKTVNVNGNLAHLGGVVDADGNFVENTSVHEGLGDVYTPNEDLKVTSETVIFLGTFNHVWGHCLTDHIKRLWFLTSDAYKKYFTSCKLVLNLMGENIIPNFVKLLKILGIDVSKLNIIRHATKFQNIILPDPSFFYTRRSGGGRTPVFTEEYASTIDKVREFAHKNFSTLPEKKFYFFHGFGKQIGEERLAKYFQSKGYAIIQPEKLPLEEQLNIFANCESFASTVGSVSHNAMFLKDETETILIPRYCDLNTIQLLLSQLEKLNVTYIDSQLSIFFQSQHGGPFCYIVSENLKKYFGDEVTEKYTEEDFSTFLSYVCYAKNIGLKENQQELTYLRNILPEFMEQLKTKTDLTKKFGITIK